MRLLPFPPSRSLTPNEWYSVSKSDQKSGDMQKVKFSTYETLFIARHGILLLLLVSQFSGWWWIYHFITTHHHHALHCTDMTHATIAKGGGPIGWKESKKKNLCRVRDTRYTNQKAWTHPPPKSLPTSCWIEFILPTWGSTSNLFLENIGRSTKSTWPIAFMWKELITHFDPLIASSSWQPMKLSLIQCLTLYLPTP